MGLFVLGCFLACLYCSLPWDDFTTDCLCWLLEQIVSKTSSLVVHLWLFFLGSSSKNLLLRQFVCRYSSWAICPRLFFLGCTSAAVLLRLSDCVRLWLFFSNSWAVCLQLFLSDSWAVCAQMFFSDCLPAHLMLFHSAGSSFCWTVPLIGQKVLLIIMILALIGIFVCRWLFVICK